MATFDERIQQALDMPEPPVGSGVIDRDPPARRAKVVLSTRVDPQHVEDIAAESERTGVTPSQILNDLIGEALAARKGRAEEAVATVTVPLDALHRALDTAVRQYVAQAPAEAA